MGTFFIVSVGTSLITKNNELNDGQRISAREEDWRYDAESYKDCLEDFIEEMAENGKLPDASAELSSLLRNKSLGPGTDDPILLLHTETIPAESCAVYIKLGLEKLGLKEISCRAVSKLSEASAQAFYDQGLPNLIVCIYEEIMKARNAGHEVVLIPTGGYKAIIPYFVLMGILLKAPCRYVYEGSDKVVELPPLPLHADLSQWTGIEAVLETLNGKPAHEAETWRIYRSCQKSLMSLLTRDEENLFKSSALCERLRERADADRGRSELQFRTQNSPLLVYLEKNGDHTLKQMFLRLAEIGPYIWKGDRVPEMADHALLHHADLFHLAERILLPVFYAYEQNHGKPFLSPEELFTLLGGLHLHDCGHVVGAVDLEDGASHRLLPTEVRDYHHILGYLRLTDPENHGRTGRWIHDALTSPHPGGNSQSLAWTQEDVRETLGTIATLGLYHRKAMKLSQTEPEEGKYPYPYPFLKVPGLDKIPCLDEFLKGSPVKIRDEILAPDRIRLLVCLLRIIDSLDEQGARTGGKEAVHFHLEQLETEARDEEERAKGLGEALENAFKFLEKSGEYFVCGQLDDIAESLFSDFKGKESKENSAKTSVKKGNSGFWQSFGNLFPLQENGTPHPLRQLGLEYAISKIRAKFKGFQKEPYREKLYVKGIDIRHRFENAKVVFQIDLKMDEEYQAHPEGKKDPRKLLENMSEEYEIAENIGGSACKIVRKMLEDAGIVFEHCC